MRKTEELKCIVSSWNETHPNRKDQPTLYFVIDKILQNIVDSLDFNVFEENPQILKFRCSNFPLVGELELKKKTNNLFLLLDLNPFSLVINGEEKSKEYEITAFKDDYKSRVAEFVFLHLDELKSQLVSLYDSYLNLSLKELYIKDVSTQFILNFNEEYNKYENFLNNIHHIICRIIGTEFLSNPLYGLSHYYKCVPKINYQYLDTGKIEANFSIVPIIGRLDDEKCFDTIFSSVKKSDELFREYSINDLIYKNVNIYCKSTSMYPNRIILNKNTFRLIFPDKYFPECSLIWAMCSIHITDEISDNKILFIGLSSGCEDKNAIYIDKENRRYYVNKMGTILAVYIQPN